MNIFCTVLCGGTSLVLMDHRSRARSAFVVLALACACRNADSATSGQEDSPKEQAAALVKKAKKAAKSSHEADAYLLYSEAAAMQPANKLLKERMESLQSRAALQAKPSPSAAAGGASSPAPAVANPEQVFDSITARELAGERQLRELPALNAKPGLQDFDLSGDARKLFDQVAQSFGLGAVYDGDYPAAGPQFRLRVTGADYSQALHDLEAATGSFVIPVSARLFLVATDTPQKRNDLEQTVAVAVQVPEAMTTQELTEIAQAVKQATNVDKIAWDSVRGEVLMRDRLSRVLPAQALFEELFSWRAQVSIEVQFLEVTDSDIVNYGFTPPTSVPAVYLGQIMNNVISTPSGVTNLLTFGGGKTLIGIGVAEAQAMFNQSTSASQNFFHAQVRSVDNQPVTFHVGEKYPVITQGYFGSTSTAQQGTTYQPPPSFTFENLGVEIKITPHVHGVDGVTLAVETSYELLTGDSVNGIPIIGRRQLNNSVRLRDGEWAIVAGLTSNTRSKTQAGFWGLDQLPGIGHLFKQTSKDVEKDNLLIAIRPQLVSLPPDQAPTRRVRVGTETRPFGPL